MKEHAAIVIKKDDKFLFIKRSLNKKTLPGIWSFPSGTKEDNENIFNTAIREAKEELNIKIVPEKIIAEKELQEFSTKLTFILCKIENEQNLKLDYNEIEKIDYLSFEEFFNKFSDNEVGHGLIWLRKNPKIWKNL